MDPQSAAFAPRDDYWRFQSEVARLQQTSAEHSERLIRLERRQDEESRMKSVWGTQSPFPSILSGTPQQQPLQQPPADAFSGFDDQSANLIGSLHLDADEEPRRVGAVSRANSVRFDETADHGHWSHPSRASMEFIPRSGSALSSHNMMERTYSHKSDGRQSSAGHSVHSMHSAHSLHSAASRANSLGIDTIPGLGVPGTIDPPGLAPGLFLLGTVPAIIRCWLTRDFKHDALLYAVVCTGSYSSAIAEGLVRKLGYEDQIRTAENGIRCVKLNMFLPEAVVRSASSRSGSPYPQLPTLTIDFNVVASAACLDNRAIQIFIGSDILRAHNADILFSTNTMTIFDDDRSKVSVPLVRPEDERAFKTLQTSGNAYQAQLLSARLGSLSQAQMADVNGLKQKSPSLAPSELLPNSKSPAESLIAGSDENKAEPRTSLDSAVSRTSQEVRPSLGVVTSPIAQPDAEPATASARTPAASSPALWDNWRRSEKPAEWGTSKSTASNYAPRPQGIKTFRLPKPTSRAVSGAQPAIPSPQSRFFEEGKRRVSAESVDGKKLPGNASSIAMGPPSATSPEASIATTGKASSLNPVGGGSAFSWLAKP